MTYINFYHNASAFFGGDRGIIKWIQVNKRQRRGGRERDLESRRELLGMQNVGKLRESISTCRIELTTRSSKGKKKIITFPNVKTFYFSFQFIITPYRVTVTHQSKH